MRSELGRLLIAGRFERLADLIGQRFEVLVTPEDLKRACSRWVGSMKADCVGVPNWTDGSWESWFRNRLSEHKILRGTADSKPQPDEWPSQNEPLLPSLFSGSPHYVCEETSPGQDNAIRALEGD